LTGEKHGWSEERVPRGTGHVCLTGLVCTHPTNHPAHPEPVEGRAHPAAPSL